MQRIFVQQPGAGLIWPGTAQPRPRWHWTTSAMRQRDRDPKRLNRQPLQKETE